MLKSFFPSFLSNPFLSFSYPFIPILLFSPHFSPPSFKSFLLPSLFKSFSHTFLQSFFHFLISTPYSHHSLESPFLSFFSIPFFFLLQYSRTFRQSLLVPSFQSLFYPTLNLFALPYLHSLCPPFFQIPFPVLFSNPFFRQLLYPSFSPIFFTHFFPIPIPSSSPIFFQFLLPNSFICRSLQSLLPSFSSIPFPIRLSYNYSYPVSYPFTVFSSFPVPFLFFNPVSYPSFL